jgi:hypothetical protein
MFDPRRQPNSGPDDGANAEAERVLRADFGKKLCENIAALTPNRLRCEVEEFSSGGIQVHEGKLTGHIYNLMLSCPPFEMSSNPAEIIPFLENFNLAVAITLKAFDVNVYCRKTTTKIPGFDLPVSEYLVHNTRTNDQNPWAGMIFIGNKQISGNQPERLNLYSIQTRPINDDGGPIRGISLFVDRLPINPFLKKQLATPQKLTIEHAAPFPTLEYDPF